MTPEGVDQARDRYRRAREAQAADAEQLARVDTVLDAIRAARADPDHFADRARAVFRGH